MQNMMDSPQFVEQMSGLLSNPQLLEQVMSSNPGLDPRMRQVFQSEGFRRMVYV